MRRTCGRLLALINDILDLAASTPACAAGKSDLDLRIVVADRCAGGGARPGRAASASNELRAGGSLAPIHKQTVHINLLPMQSRRRVGASRSGCAARDAVAIAVDDTGIGIAADDIPGARTLVRWIRAWRKYEGVTPVCRSPQRGRNAWRNADAKPGACRDDRHGHAARQPHRRSGESHRRRVARLHFSRPRPVSPPASRFGQAAASGQVGKGEGPLSESRLSRP